MSAFSHQSIYYDVLWTRTSQLYPSVPSVFVHSESMLPQYLRNVP